MAGSARRATIKPSPIEMAKCAGPFRHKWDDAPAEGDADYGAVCERCSSTRQVVLDVVGKVIKRRYKHSPAYRSFLDSKHRKSPSDLRLDWVKHLKAEQRATKKRADARKRAHAR